MHTMVAATANTITDPSFALTVGSRSSGRIAMFEPLPSAVLAERIAHAVHGADVLRLGRLVPELPPDPGHVRVHHPPPGVVAIAPHPVHELVPIHHNARRPGQGEEDLELQRGELDLFA